MAGRKVLQLVDGFSAYIKALRELATGAGL